MLPTLLAALSVLQQQAQQPPAQVDWRTKGVTTPVMDQGQMGSAVAYSMAEAMSAYDAINTGQVPAILSAGQIADCSFCGTGATNTSSYSDRAGDPIAQTWECIDKTLGGVCTESDYPRSTGKCPKKNICTPAFLTKGLQLAELNDEASMTAAVAKGVVLAGIDASNPAFESYTGGVYSGKGCGTQVDHVLSVAGYNTAAPSYWLLQNSWGPNWGMEGFMLLGRSADNTCGIYTVAYGIQKMLSSFEK